VPVQTPAMIEVVRAASASSGSQWPRCASPQASRSGAGGPGAAGDEQDVGLTGLVDVVGGESQPVGTPHDRLPATGDQTDAQVSSPLAGASQHLQRAQGVHLIEPVVDDDVYEHVLVLLSGPVPCAPTTGSRSRHGRRHGAPPSDAGAGDQEQAGQDDTGPGHLNDTGPLA
jgi:hypothetical protein